MMNITRLPIAGCHVAVLDVAGNDPSIQPRIYLHGLGSSSILTFASIVSEPPLSDARSILIDLPGFGHSATQPSTGMSSECLLHGIEAHAGIVAGLLDQLNLGTVDLFGHSMGGSIAIVCAYRFPELIVRLVVAEPNLDPGRGTLSAHIAAQTEQRFMARGYDALLHATYRQAARGNATARSFVQTLEMASPLALHRSATSLLAERRPTFREMLEQLPMPKATITGALSLAYGFQLADSGIREYVVPDAGHVMMVENPTDFAQGFATALASLTEVTLD